MQNFDYLVPTQVVFGRKTQARVGSLASGAGASKVLVHYGGGSVKHSGLFDDVIESLDKAELPWVELGGVVPNPRLSKVYEGIELARSESVDFILAVGGGSVIDSAKGIAAGLANPDTDVWDFYSGKTLLEKAMPLGVVLTLSAAGSETSKSSVVSRDSDGSKRPINNNVIRPRFAVMNPELTYTLPPYQTACGIVDIMSHTLERYLSTEPGGDVTGGMSEALLKAMVKNGRAALDNPEDYEARAEIMWAGSLSHSDLLGVGRIPDWASHRIEHEMTRHTNIAHGAGLAIVMPALFRYVVDNPVDMAHLARLAVTVWGVEPQSLSEKELALEGIGRMMDFFRSIGMPVSLPDAGINPNLIPEMAGTVQRSPEGIVGLQRKLSEEEVIAILETAC